MVKHIVDSEYELYMREQGGRWAAVCAKVEALWTRSVEDGSNNGEMSAG